jgi:hypothetical protein
MFIALLLLLALVTVPDRAKPSPSPSPSPEASPTPTPSPAPSPLTLSEAVEAFKELVNSGEEDGLIESEAAEDLRNLADEIANAADDDGGQGQINKAIRDLRRAIDEFERDGRIGSADVANRLREAVGAIERAEPGGGGGD